jgi:hypothetical protein
MRERRDKQRNKEERKKERNKERTKGRQKETKKKTLDSVVTIRLDSEVCKLLFVSLPTVNFFILRHLVGNQHFRFHCVQSSPTWYWHTHHDNMPLEVACFAWAICIPTEVEPTTPTPIHNQATWTTLHQHAG